MLRSDFSLNTLKERTYVVLSILLTRENGNNGTKNTRKKAAPPNKQKGEKKERNTCGYRGACISKDGWTRVAASTKA